MMMVIIVLVLLLLVFSVKVPSARGKKVKARVSKRPWYHIMSMPANRKEGHTVHKCVATCRKLVQSGVPFQTDFVCL